MMPFFADSRKEEKHSQARDPTPGTGKGWLGERGEMFVKEGDTGPKLLPAAAKLRAAGSKSKGGALVVGGADSKKLMHSEKVKEYHKQAEFGAKKFIKP